MKLPEKKKKEKNRKALVSDFRIYISVDKQKRKPKYKKKMSID